MVLTHFIYVYMFICSFSLIKLIFMVCIYNDTNYYTEYIFLILNKSNDKREILPKRNETFTILSTSKLLS